MRKGVAIAAVVAAIFAGGMIWYASNYDEGGARQTDSAERDDRGEASAEARVAIRGRVVDGVGEPVEGATVVVGGEATERVTTDAEGRFDFPATKLPAGDYQLDVQARGYVAPGPKPLRVAKVTVPPPSERDGPIEVKLTVRRPVRLAGKVVAGGTPLSGVRLSLYYKHADGLSEPTGPFALDGVAKTDSRGRFSMSAAPGRLRLIVETEEYGSKQSRDLYLESGALEDGLTIDMAPTGTLSGQVLGRGTQPLRAKLVLSSERLAQSRRTRTAVNGAFVFEKLPTGDYTLRVSADGHLSKALNDVKVESGEVARKKVELEPAKGVFGLVLGPEGEPVTGAFVHLKSAEGRQRWIRTDKFGRFQWANAPQSTWTGRAYSQSMAASEPATASTGSELRMQMKPGGFVKGTIVDTDGQPVKGAKLGVGAFSVDGPTPYGPRGIGRKRVTSEDGSFRYGPLRPGSYELVARADGYASSSSHEIRVSGGSTAGPIEIALGEGGVVTGVIRSARDDEPLANATVSVFDMTSPFEPRRTKTDRQGRYEITRVPAGRRSLRVGHGGYLTRVVSGLRVPNGGESSQDVTLEVKKDGERFAFRGIGATLRKTSEGPVVQGTIKGGGAARQGLKRGDVIRAVDGEVVTDWPLPKVIQTIRGREGEPVTLRLERDGRRFNVEIVRGRVVVSN